MLRILYGTHCKVKKRKLTNSQISGRRHLEFRKSVVISLLFDQSSPNSVGMLRIWHTTQLLHWNCIFTKIQDGGRRHLEFWKSVAISLLLDQSSPNLVGMLKIWHRTQMLHRKCIFTEIQDGGIPNDCCDFVAIGLICIKFDGNLTTPI